MKKFILFALLSITSCATFVPASSYEEKNDSPIGQALKVEIGSSLISYHAGHYAKAIIIKEDAPSKSKDITTQIKAGSTYVLARTAGVKEYYFPEGSKYINGYMNASHGIVIDTKKNSQELYILSGMAWSAQALANPLKYSFTDNKPDPEKSFFEKRFLYNGKSGSTIKFTYREFSDNLARPSFSQDLTYDLSESNIIGFQGMRIEVLKATNIDIEYKILNGFSK